MDKVTIIGIIASILTALSLLPQLIKILKEKRAENISLYMLVILFCGLGFWIYYGIIKEDLIIIASNSISIFLNSLLVFFALKYKLKK